MLDVCKNIVITMGKENSIKFEFEEFPELLIAVKALFQTIKEDMKSKRLAEEKIVVESEFNQQKIAENLAKMIKEAMEKAPNQILHFGEITKDGEVRELTSEEFAEKYLKGEGKKRKKIYLGEENENKNTSNRRNGSK